MNILMDSRKLRWPVIRVALLFLPLLACQPQGREETSSLKLVPLHYNNPGLVTDLGVGLWAWPLPMDYDGDGDMDLVVSCPDTPYNGLYFFENTGSGNTGMPVFKAAVRIGKGRKNIQLCYIDGKPRILGRGVEFNNFTDSAFRNPVTIYPKEELEKEFKRIRFSQWRYVDFDNDGDLDLLVGIDEWGDYGWDNAFNQKGEWTRGPLHGYVYLIENEEGKYGTPRKIEAGGGPVDVFGAPSPNMEDFDGDGDLDLICGEFLDRFTWFENVGTRSAPEYAKGRFLKNKDGLIKMDLEMIVPMAVDWDRDGDVDLVVGNEDGRVAWLENTGEVRDHMPVFRSPVYFQQEADLLKFGALATPFSVDWDSDGDEDLICGNTAGYIGFIENMDGGNPPRWNKPRYLEAGGKVIRIMAGDSGSIQGPAEKKWGYTTLSVADWDGDGLLDIIFNSIWGKVMWFKNTGTKGHPVLSPAQPVKLESEGIPLKPSWNWWNPADHNLVTQWRTTPFALDWNQDGLVDLIMLDTEGYLSYFERSVGDNGKILLPGKRIFAGINASVLDNKNNVMDSTESVLRLNNKEAGGSGRRKICFTDWDQDGDLDLIVNSINASVFENTGTSGGKVLFRLLGPVADKKLSGHTTSPTTVDWDGDNRPELLIGAEDGHFYYLTSGKQEEPATGDTR